MCTCLLNANINTLFQMLGFEWYIQVNDNFPPHNYGRKHIQAYGEKLCNTMSFLAMLIPDSRSLIF
jgi:hypothetical protein